MLNLPINEGELTFLAKFVNCAPILLCGRIAHTACIPLVFRKSGVLRTVKWSSLMVFGFQGNLNGSYGKIKEI